jgi:hypothetical protein
MTAQAATTTKIVQAEDAAADAEIRRAAERIKAADAERGLMLALPAVSDLFPRMVAERTLFYMRQLGFRSIDGFTSPDSVFWWNELLGERDRRFVCRVARLDAGLSAMSWIQLEAEQRCRVLAAFMWLRDWVNQFQLPMCPYVEQATRDD